MSIICGQNRYLPWFDAPVSSGQCVNHMVIL